MVYCSHLAVRYDLQEMHHMLENFINILSVILNGFLLYLIAFHSTEGMRPYTPLITIDVGLDFLLGLVILQTQHVSSRLLFLVNRLGKIRKFVEVIQFSQYISCFFSLTKLS